jgi:hypothetical protein
MEGTEKLRPLIAGKFQKPCWMKNIKNYPFKRMLAKLDAILWRDTVWFQFLMAVSLKTAFLWVVVPCSLVEVNWCFGGACCLHQGDDGGSKHLWNVG